MRRASQSQTNGQPVPMDGFRKHLPDISYLVEAAKSWDGTQACMATPIASCAAAPTEASEGGDCAPEPPAAATGGKPANEGQH